MVSESTGRVVPKTCKSWLCPSCNLWLRIGAESYLLAGIVEGLEADDAVSFLTLTDDASGTLDLAGLSRTWDRTRKALRRTYGMTAYGLAVEPQKRGALHAHAIVRTPPEAVAMLPTRDRELAKQRTRTEWRHHFHELVPMVRDLGWGPMVSWSRVDNPLASSKYAAKAMAGYATKPVRSVLAQRAKERVRPLRASRNWTTGRGLRDHQGGADADPGPWRDVLMTSC